MSRKRNKNKKKNKSVELNTIPIVDSKLDVIKNKLKHTQSPPWAKEAGKMIRSGERIKAIKHITSEENCSLMKAKKAVDYYVEYGKWQNEKWVHKSHLEKAFIKVMGISIENANKKWKEDPQKYLDWYKENNVVCISERACFSICEEYLNQILKR